MYHNNKDLLLEHPNSLATFNTLLTEEYYFQSVEKTIDDRTSTVSVKL
jgi:hypothetical protein